MEIIEQLSNINYINNEEKEEDTNNSSPDSSNLMNKEHLHRIEPINYGLDNFCIKNEIECFYSQINNCSIKERLILNTLLSISKSIKKSKKQKILTYNDIFDNEGNNDDNERDSNLDKKIFVAVDRVAHKTLHEDQLIDGKRMKVCSIYNDINTMVLKERENISYSNIDKLIYSLKEKEKSKNLEFIAIKAIIVAIINFTNELINNYLKKSCEINYNIMNDEEYYYSDDEDINNIIIIKPHLFENILLDYASTSNRCSFLENYFINSFNDFREKYQISFTLTELFTDIFWNCIFHNKILCNKFISIYIGNDSNSESIRKTLSTIIKIISDISVSLKSKIIQLLSLKNIENMDDIDLMTAIVKQKSINHDLIKNENMINIVNKSSLNREYMINIDTNNDDNTNNNNDNNNNNKNNINNNNNRINICNNDTNKEKDKNDKNMNENENDLEHKTVDEVFNYINDNKEIKTKKKKRKEKRKGKKMETEIKSYNEDNNNNNSINEEDLIVLQFKHDIGQEVVNANEIHKVKPVVSEGWIKKISDY